MRLACTRRKSAFLRTWRLISSSPTSLSSISASTASIASGSAGPSMISSSSASRAAVSVVSSRARRCSGARRASLAAVGVGARLGRAVAVLVQGGQRLVDHGQAPPALHRAEALADLPRGDQRLLGLVQTAQADQRVRHPDTGGDRRREVLAEQPPAHGERIGEAANRLRRVALLAQRHPQAVGEVVRAAVLDTQIRPHRKRLAQLLRRTGVVALDPVAFGDLRVHLGVVERRGSAGAVGLAERDPLEALCPVHVAALQSLTSTSQVGESPGHPATNTMCGGDRPPRGATGGSPSPATRSGRAPSAAARDP